jgi:mono/diheme cytochrome c family protein
MKAFGYRILEWALLLFIVVGPLCVIDLRSASALGAGVKDSNNLNAIEEGGRGEELYNASCVVCHGPGATGGIGPRLAGNPVLSNDQAFKKIMKEGRHMMPPLTDAITEQQMAGIRAWLKTLR